MLLKNLSCTPGQQALRTLDNLTLAKEHESSSGKQFKRPASLLNPTRAQASLHLVSLQCQDTALTHRTQFLVLGLALLEF
jgi:hypothetical protein